MHNAECIQETMDLLFIKKEAKEWKEFFEDAKFEKEFYYDGNDLGAVYSREKTSFKVWAPTAVAVSLNLYTTGSDEEANAELLESVSMKREEKGIFTSIIMGDLHGVYYTYTITANGQTVETGDVYAKACGVNGFRSMVVDLERTNPDGWEKDQHVLHPLEDTQIWEVHIGDFSNDPASGVNPAHRGKYLAFIQENTTLENDGVHPTCLAYLKQLGITHVHLLPSFDYGSVDERIKEGNFNWGYDPVNYNVPEGSYATDAFHGATRIQEYKQMVAALHQAGISVVMDVVYNHTHSLDSHFNRTVPYYYYRQWEDGAFANGSACGNDTASDRAMFRKYMIDSVVYWAKEYHIDGFRFDLMGLHDVETMNEIRRAVDELGEYGEDMMIYGEPWSATESPLKEGMKPAKKDAILQLHERIAMFNDDTRDCIKGAYDELEDPGFANGKTGIEEEVKRALRGMFAREWTAQPDNPARVLNYASAHDNSTLWDKLVDSVMKDHDYETKHETLVAMNKLAAAMVQFSKGIPFMQAGEEAGRTKLGEDNSYNLSKELNWLDWKRMYRFEDLTNYYKGLMSVRKSLKDVKALTKEAGNEIDFLEGLPEQVVGYRLGSKSKTLVIFNASNKTVEVPLEGEWKLLVDERKAKSEGIKTISKKVCTKPISANILVQIEI